jgi:hypothetical protein
MAKRTSDELSAGKTPVSLHPLNKDIPLAGINSVMKDPASKPWLRQFEADHKGPPRKKARG